MSSKGLKLEEKIQSAFAELEKLNIMRASGFICKIFVNHIEDRGKLNNIDVSGKINIEGGRRSRDITIHPYRKQD
jgi:hypothetical protein